MMTNYSITIKRRSLSGSSVTDATVGTYDVWLEGTDTRTRRRIGGDTNELDIPYGMFFLFDDVDLTDCFATVDSVDYPIIGFARFLDRDGNFHHIEAEFSK